ncbi:hypothetical protein [Paractinoplanes rishiriensis]|uniref:Uncharacterized protein n=1 Tax=Paractinoplanes rishiriensis TaxID=1050105 RepID=A0A919MVJ5_9ACTN|nr:hypothetical protein [Actinoplanes rishiriensis]GIF01482.1 hypothetical protein Ari01nite_89460 [Actinoplanes rishiriensis]
MNEIADTAYNVTSQIFGPESGVPWWAWMFVLVAMFWKVAVSEPKTAQEAAEDRDRALIAEIADGNGGGKKGKKGKK